MSENFIELSKSAVITDEFAQKEDKRKAYRILNYAFISAAILTVAMYILPELLLG